ncbi:hypothetical protein GOBAR_DD02910 [Gossypium barbadense]|nr:hypothetical protein GOBAR_DD02910 [Gossypium barbadense]
MSNFYDKVAGEGWLRRHDGLAAFTIPEVVVTLTVATLVIIYFSRLVKKLIIKTKPSPLPPPPPGPIGLPILGHLLFIKPDFLQYVTEQSKIHGPIIKLQLGRKVCIIISSPSIAKQILKPRRHLRQPQHSGGGHKRNLWRTRHCVEIQWPRIAQATKARQIRYMVKNIHGKIGSPINLSEQIFLTTFNVTVNMLWGGSLNGEESNLGIEFKDQFEEFVRLMVEPNVSDMFPVLRPVKGDVKTSISMKEINAVLLNIVTGATDTAFTTIEWAMTELLRHPDKLRRVIEELDAIIGDQNIVEEFHLPRLLYLEAVVKETLRIHPPAPLLMPHMPSETIVVAGYTIPKNSNIFFNVWAIQRDAEFWEDPLQFEPERFLNVIEKRNYKGNSFDFFPFGSGRRICIGISMAEKIMMLVLATLLYCFEWELPNGQKPDAKEHLRLVLSKVEPLLVVPISRSSNSMQYQ